MTQANAVQLNSFAQQWLDEPQPSAAVFSAGPMVPERTNWLSDLAKPWVSFGTSLSEAAASTYDDLPARLFEWGMDELGGSKKRTVQQGGGTSTTYVQPRNPGGAPADPNYVVIQPGQQQGGIVPAQSAGMSNFLLVGIGLIIFLAVRK